MICKKKKNHLANEVVFLPVRYEIMLSAHDGIVMETGMLSQK